MKKFSKPMPPPIPLKQEPKVKMPRTWEARAVSMPGKMITHRLIKPVGST